MSYIIDCQYIQLSKKAFELDDVFEIMYFPALLINGEKGDMLYYVQELCLMEIDKYDANLFHFVYDTTLQSIEKYINKPKLNYHIKYVRNNFGFDASLTSDRIQKQVSFKLDLINLVNKLEIKILYFKGSYFLERYIKTHHPSIELINLSTYPYNLKSVNQLFPSSTIFSNISCTIHNIDKSDCSILKILKYYFGVIYLSKIRSNNWPANIRLNYISRSCFYYLY